jgi:hypothetical protein
MGRYEAGLAGRELEEKDRGKTLAEGMQILFKTKHILTDVVHSTSFTPITSPN